VQATGVSQCIFFCAAFCMADAAPRKMRDASGVRISPHVPSNDFTTVLGLRQPIVVCGPGGRAQASLLRRQVSRSKLVRCSLRTEGRPTPRSLPLKPCPADAPQRQRIVLKNIDNSLASAMCLLTDTVADVKAAIAVRHSCFHLCWKLGTRPESSATVFAAVCACRLCSGQCAPHGSGTGTGLVAPLGVLGVLLEDATFRVRRTAPLSHHSTWACCPAAPALVCRPGSATRTSRPPTSRLRFMGVWLRTRPWLVMRS
jgi:hypothetical protein